MASHRQQLELSATGAQPARPRAVRSESGDPASCVPVVGAVLRTFPLTSRFAPVATLTLALAFAGSAGVAWAAGKGPAQVSRPKIIRLDPPEQGFFAKELFCHGIPIKAPAVVVDKALYAAYDRISMELQHLPMVTSNLIAAGVEVHIIGRNQVTSDLPEFRNLKGKPLPEYHGLTIDQRTRGMGGRLTSCGEENLLKLKNDHYYGRDILVHEFAHSIRNYGLPRDVVALFNAQYHKSLANGLWKGAYAGSNPDEYFAELTMWYFGTHGDLNMTGPKPANGPAGLKKYDPAAYKLLHDFYRGRIPIAKVEPRPRRWHPRHDPARQTTNSPAAADSRSNKRS